MIKSCKGCKAIEYLAGNRMIPRCGLGYPTHDLPNTFTLAPSVHCPKPRTWKDFDDCDTYEEFKAAEAK